jgi:hypothetical protein
MKPSRSKKLNTGSSSVTVNNFLRVDSFCQIGLAPNFAVDAAEPTVSKCNVANDESV